MRNDFLERVIEQRTREQMEAAAREFEQSRCQRCRIVYRNLSRPLCSKCERELHEEVRQ